HRSLLLSSGFHRHRKVASYRGPLRVRDDRESPANHCRAVFHNVKPHTGALPWPRGDSTTSIAHQQERGSTAGAKLNFDVPGLAVLDRVAHRFLRDVIKMAGHGRIVDEQ